MSTAEQIPPASATGEVEKPDAPSSTEVQQPPAEAPKPAAAEPDKGKAPDPVATKADVTSAVTKLLVDGKIDGVEAVKTVPPESDPKAPAAGAPAVKAPASEGAPAGEPDLPDVPHPYALADDPGVADLDGRSPEKTRVAFHKLKDRLHNARAEGAFGAMIVDVATDAGMDPDAITAVIALTAKAKKGDVAAVNQLRDTFSKLGIAIAPAAAAPIDKEILKAVEAEKVYKQLFEADVKSADMTEEKARAKALVIAEERLKNPALSQPTTVQPPAQQQPQAPAAGQLSPVEARALSDVDGLSKQYAAAYQKVGADFEPVRAAARALIVEKVKLHGPINPMYWPYEFSKAVQQVQATRKKAAAPAATTVNGTGLRPGTGGTSVAGGTKPGDFKAPIVEKLVSGDWNNI